MFGPVNFLVRWVFILFLVFATYNPSGRSYYHWAVDGDAPSTIIAVVGIAIFACYAFIVRAMWRSIKPVGAMFVIVFLAFFNVMLVDVGFVTVTGDWVVTVMFLLSLATLFVIGVSFSAIRARISGQIDSDDVGR